MADINGLVKRQATLVANTPQKITFDGSYQTLILDCMTDLSGTDRIAFAINRDVATATEDVSIALHPNAMSFSDWNPSKIKYVSVCSNVAATIQWRVR